MDPSASNEPIAIVVVPRDRFSTFPRCLDALYANTSVRFRVVVVVGNPDAATKSYLRQLQEHKENLRLVLADHLLMQGEARNIGMRLIEERLCVVLENDTIVGENWLPPMLECMREETAAVVVPLVLWYRGLHAAGGAIEERVINGKIVLRHRILYSDIRRKRVDYPENHCMLIDRRILPDPDIFDDVEPFDVDLGLTLRRRGLTVFLEPRSTATYSAPPPLETRDISPYKFRWDRASWELRNRRFMQKWEVVYDPSSKLASYQRQQLKLGIAGIYPNNFTVQISNLTMRSANFLLSLVKRKSMLPR